MSEEARKQVSLFTKQASFWYVCFNQTMLGKVHRQGMPKVEQQLFVVCSIWRDLGPSINIAFKKAPVKLAVRGKVRSINNFRVENLETRSMKGQIHGNPNTKSHHVLWIFLIPRNCVLTRIQHCKTPVLSRGWVVMTRFTTRLKELGSGALMAYLCIWSDVNTEDSFCFIEVSTVDVSSISKFRSKAKIIPPARQVAWQQLRHQRRSQRPHQWGYPTPA